MNQRSLAILIAAITGVLAFGGGASDAAGSGYLKVNVNPGRAGVFANGRYLGPAKNFRMTRKYALPAGDYEVTLSEPRYRDFTTKVKIETGRTSVISQQLEAVPLAQPPFGELRTASANKFDAVYVNGKFMGHVDEFDGPRQRLLLNPGEYAVKIVPVAGGEGVEKKVTIKENQVTLVDVKSR